MTTRRAIEIAAAALCVIALAACGFGGSIDPGGQPPPSPSASVVAVPSLPGTPGHYDDGMLSFDYPLDWPVLAARVPESCGVIYVLAVLGLGSWGAGANQPQSNGAILCGFDTVTVRPGGIVVRIYWRDGGPAPVCEGDTQANATFALNAAQERVDGAVTSWEIRVPGGEFGMPNNPVFEVHTSDQAQLARAEAVVASFRWGASAPDYSGLCSPSPAVS